MRAQGCTELYRSDSFDYGETWQDAYPCGIPSASSKITLLSRRGKILLIHNACAETESMEGRKNLSIWVSEDGMHSWSTKYKLLAQDESMFYPHAFLDEERKALPVRIPDSPIACVFLLANCGMNRRKKWGKHMYMWAPIRSEALRESIPCLWIRKAA